jgi:uncharacterized membrane protein YgcG
VPPVPYYYILDEPAVLDQTTLHSVESLLVEHDRLTGEQFMVGIFDEIPAAELKNWTHEIFKKWRIGQRGQDNGILLVISLKNQKAAMEAGLGLDSVITGAKSKEFLSASLEKELKNLPISLALKKETYRVLEALSSPLIQSGKADDLIRNGDGTTYASVSGSWIVLFILGLILLLAVLNEILSREAHFTANGWFRPSTASLVLYFFSGHLSFLRWKKNQPEAPGGTSGSW